MIRSSLSNLPKSWWLLPRNTHPAPSPTERTPDKPDLVMLWEDGMVLKHQNSHLHPEEEDYQKLVYKTPTTADCRSSCLA